MFLPFLSFLIFSTDEAKLKIRDDLSIETSMRNRSIHRDFEDGRKSADRCSSSFAHLHCQLWSPALTRRTTGRLRCKCKQNYSDPEGI
ncbi:hypothetical protein BDW72DRAFT_183380 [Aspergillus terricola var. indicus]